MRDPPKPPVWHLVLAALALTSLLIAGCRPPSTPSPASKPAGKEAARKAASPKPAASPRPAASPSPAAGSAADRLRTLEANIDAALTALGSGDVAKARQSYEGFDQGWDRVEDDVKARSPAAYTAIEDAMDDVKAMLLEADNPDPA